MIVNYSSEYDHQHFLFDFRKCSTTKLCFWNQPYVSKLFKKYVLCQFPALKNVLWILPTMTGFVLLYLGHHLTQSQVEKTVPSQMYKTPTFETMWNRIHVYYSHLSSTSKKINQYFSHKTICLMMHKSIQARKEYFCNSNIHTKNFGKGFTRITRFFFNKDIDIYCNWWFICPMTKTESLLQIKLVIHYLRFWW